MPWHAVAHDMGVVATHSFLPVKWMVQAPAPKAFVGTGDMRMNAKYFKYYNNDFLHYI